MRRFGLGVGLLGVVVLSAVGSGVAAAPKPLPLRARLIERGEFPGFTLQAPTAYKTAKAWVATGPHIRAQAEVARLTREGFKGLLAEFLDSAQGRGSGLSWVMQLGSTTSARAELATEVRDAKAQGQAETFRVSAIPGAVGFGGAPPAGQGAGGENIIFSDGPFLYLVGNGWSGSSHNPSRAALIGAATKLYKRVHGHPAG